MASITISNIENDLKNRLRIRTANNGHSMEEEARIILRRAIDGITGAELAPKVKSWLLTKTGDQVLVTTAVTISEIEYGHQAYKCISSKNKTIHLYARNSDGETVMNHLKLITKWISNECGVHTRFRIVRPRTGRTRA